MKLRHFLYTVVLVTVAVAVQAQAPPPPGPGPTPPGAPPPPRFSPGQMPRTMGSPMGPGLLSAVRVPPAPMITRLEEELNLTEDQKTKVQTALDKYNEKTKSLNEQYRSATTSLHESMSAPKFDAAKAKADAAKALKAEDGLVSASIDFWGDFRSVLTSEQNQKLSGMMPGSGRMMPRPGFGGPRRNGQMAPPPVPPAPGE